MVYSDFSFSFIDIESIWMVAAKRLGLALVAASVLAAKARSRAPSIEPISATADFRFEFDGRGCMSRVAVGVDGCWVQDIHSEAADDGVRSFGVGCGEPLEICGVAQRRCDCRAEWRRAGIRKRSYDALCGADAPIRFTAVRIDAGDDDEDEDDAFRRRHAKYVTEVVRGYPDAGCERMHRVRPEVGMGAGDSPLTQDNF